MSWNDIRWFAAYVGLMTVMIPFALLPPKVAATAGEKLGILLSHILSKWNRKGIQTVASFMPYLSIHSPSASNSSPEAIIRQVFVNTGIMIAELSRLYCGNCNSLIAAVEFRGLEHYQKAHAQGRGIIGITAHCGNWELMALALGLKTNPLAVVARTMKKDYFSRVLEKLRTRFGNKVIYRDNGVKEMLLFLKSGGLVGILPDQVVRPPHGILVDFFGRPCWTTVMPVKLALKTGSPILPFFIYRENGRNIVTIQPEIELLPGGSDQERILDGTIKMNQVIEKHILQHPTQWNWLYRRWKGVH
jgi:KDO2-lipid IV(A) lauroyltransferase